MISNRILYDILEVDVNASQKQIKKAYLRKMKTIYPSHDLRTIEEQNCQSIIDAYSILSDPEKRKLYDEHGLSINTQTTFDNNPAFNIFGNMNMDLFSKQRTEDIFYTINVTLEDLYKGKTVNLLIKRNIICAQCKGDQISNGCKVCNDKKLIEEKKKITVNIEPGMEDGEKITFYGCSDEDFNKETGDFIACLHLIEHPIFKRKNDNLLMTKKINLYDALAGSKIKIDLIDGRSVVLSPEPNETVQNDSVKRIKNEGMPKRNNPHEKGDLFIKFEVEFPQKSQLSPQFFTELKKCIQPSNNEFDPVLNDQNVEMINSNINEFD